MDEKEVAKIKNGDSLPLTDSVYRTALSSEKEVNAEGQLIPKESCFSLTTDDIADFYRLSVTWDKKATPEEVLIQLGTSFIKNKPGKYKNYTTRVLYKLEVGFLNERPFILDVILDGSQNNLSHSLICFDYENYNYEQLRPRFISELRDHAKQFIVNIDMNFVQEKVEQIRKRKEEEL